MQHESPKVEAVLLKLIETALLVNYYLAPNILVVDGENLSLGNLLQCPDKNDR